MLNKTVQFPGNITIGCVFCVCKDWLISYRTVDCVVSQVNCIKVLKLNIALLGVTNKAEDKTI